MTNADDLRRLVWEADATGDVAVLEAACRAHRDAILQHFAGWQKLPPPLRDSRPAVERYVATMVRVAELFEQKLGKPELLRLLRGDPETNPLSRWLQKLDEAQAAMAQLRYAETASMLADLLIDVRDLRGTGVEAYLPVTLGYIGECWFQTGQAAKALEPTRAALEHAIRLGDSEGTTAFLGNLYEIHRYLGQSAEAATDADRLAERFEKEGKGDEAARYRKQATIVRAGEPLNRVVVGVDGKRLELDDVLAGETTGRVQFGFERNRLTLRPAQVLTERGQRQGQAGRFDAALGLFRDAAAADRYAPHAHYEAGLTLVYLQRYGEGVESLETTEELAPGWFHCRTDLWLAQQLQLGKVPQEVFMLCRALEDGPGAPTDKLKLAQQGLSQCPELAVLHLGRGKCLRAAQRAAEAAAAFRTGLTHAAEPDVRTRLLVDLAGVIEAADERRELLRQAVALNGNLVAAATAAIVLAGEE